MLLFRLLSFSHSCATTQFIERACSFLDNLITALKKQNKALDEYIHSTYEVTHAFHRFSYNFDAEDESTTSGELLIAASTVGSYGTHLRSQMEEHLVCHRALRTTAPQFAEVSSCS